MSFWPKYGRTVLPDGGVVIFDFDPMQLFDRIDNLRKNGYQVEELAYTTVWFFWVKYHALLKKRTLETKKGRIEFVIGPVSVR